MHSWDTIMDYLHSVHKILDSCPSNTHTSKKKIREQKLNLNSRNIGLFYYFISQH